RTKERPAREGRPFRFQELLAAGWRVVLDAVPVNLAAPGAGGGPAGFDELLEAFQVTFDLALQEAHVRPDRLDDSLGIRIELERHPRVVRAERLEQDGAGVLGTLGALPGDPGIRDLVGDVGGPLLPPAGDLGGPAQRLVVHLDDGLDGFHELGEALELGPLVVGDADRNVDVDGVLEPSHRFLLCFWGWNRGWQIRRSCRGRTDRDRLTARRQPTGAHANRPGPRPARVGAR